MNTAVLVLVMGCVPLAVWMLLTPAASIRAWVLLLSAVPILRVTFGGVPIYAIDVLAVGVFVGLSARGAVRSSWRDLPARVRALIAAYAISLTIPLILQLARMSLAPEPLYGFGRELAALSALLIGATLGRTASGTSRVLLLMTAGGALGGALAIAQRIPGIAPIVNDTLRAISPGLASGAARTYPGRSTAFMAAPTALSGFLCITLLLLLFTPHRRQSFWYAVATLLMTGGLLSTYSRQWLPVFVVGLVVAARVGSGRAPRRSRRLLMVGLVATTLIFTVGPLDVDYLVDRFTATGTDDANLSKRLERQRQFAQNLVEQPLTFVAGEGFALQDIGERQALGGAGTSAARPRLGYTDNSFLLELANRGVLAVTLYTAILFASMRRVVRLRRLIGRVPELVGLMGALTAAVVLHLFDNYFSEAMFMRMTLWLLVGLLLGATGRLVRGPAPQRRASVAASPGGAQ